MIWLSTAAQEKHQYNVGPRRGGLSDPLPVPLVGDSWDDCVAFPRPVPSTELQALMEAAPYVDPEVSSEELAEDSERFADSMEEDLQSLTDRQRAILYMYTTEGMTQTAIAERLGITQQVVNVHISKIRNKLAGGSYLAGKMRRKTGRPSLNLPVDGEQAWLEWAQRASRLMTMGTDNSVWRASRLLSDCLHAGAPLGRLGRLVGYPPETVRSLVREFRNG